MQNIQEKVEQPTPSEADRVPLYVKESLIKTNRWAKYLKK